MTDRAPQRLDRAERLEKGTGYMSLQGMTLQDYVDHARVLFRRYAALDPDDVTPAVDAARAGIEQEGYRLLERLVDHLHRVMPGLRDTIGEEQQAVSATPTRSAQTAYDGLVVGKFYRYEGLRVQLVYKRIVGWPGPAAQFLVWIVFPNDWIAEVEATDLAALD